MTDFKVDVAALEALKSKCESLLSGLEELSKDLKGLIDGIPSSKLRDAVHGFDQHWGDGKLKLQSHAEGMVKRLDHAIAQYKHTEDGLRSQMVTKGHS